jgi:capsular exopolysaccharide synthesis family protein
MNEQDKVELYARGPRLERGGLNLVDNRVVDLSDAYEILEPEEPLDLRAYGRIIRKRLATILIVFFLVFAIGLIATLKEKPVYRAQVLLEIQKENADIPTIKDLYELESVSDSYLKTQYDILASESLARRVIDELHLDALREFNKPKWWSLERFNGASRKQTVGLGPVKAAHDSLVYQRVLERFQDRLTIEPVSRSRLITVRFDSSNAELSARIVNTLAEDYIDQSLEARWMATQKATDWLSQQLVGVKGKLENSEEQLQDYARHNGLVFLEDDKGATQNVTNERLQEIQEELTKAQADRYEKESVYRLVQSGDYGSLPGVVENKLIQDLSERLSELKRELAQLSTKFNPEYPRVKEIQSQIDEIEATLKDERQRAADKITNEYLAAVRREELVNQALGEQQKQVNVIAEKAVQYNIIKREVETNKQLYEGLLQRLKEAGVSASLKASNIRVVDSADPPAKPAEPRIPLNLTVAALLGLGLGISTAFLQERLDDTLKGADEVERLFGLSALALIPSVHSLNGDRPSVRKLLDRTLPLKSGHNGHNGTASNPAARWHRIDQVDRGEKPQAALVEAFRSLRASVLLSTADHPPGSLLITSTQPSEGKTTVATNLAISLAQLGQRVLLVDADLRFPSLQRLFCARESLGLVSYLTGQQDWRAAVCPSGSPGLDLLLCGPVPPNPAELLSSKSMGAFINAAKSEYGFVILDSSPLLALADSRILAALVDGVLLVVKSGATPRGQVIQSQSSIRSAGANLIGVVLNSVTLHTNGYYGLGIYGSNGNGNNNGNSHSEMISDRADSWSTLSK